MKGYGQFCPVAKATEVLGERWTILVIRELLAGPAGFNDIRHGVPLMSPSLLSSRLKFLCRAGLVIRRDTADGVYYELSQAGGELQPIILQLGLWSLRWARSDFSDADLDVKLLMWDMRRQIDATAPVLQRAVLRFEFLDQPGKLRFWWLIVENEEVDVCLKDPGHEVDLYISTDLASMARVWMGDMEVRAALAADKIQLEGPAELCRSFPDWLGRNPFAEPERLEALLKQQQSAIN